MAGRNHTTKYPGRLLAEMRKSGTRLMVKREAAKMADAPFLCENGEKTGKTAVSLLCESGKLASMAGVSSSREDREPADRIGRTGAPFLCENGEPPRTGEIYSSLEIAAFQYDHKTGQFHLEANLRFAEKCREITMYADLYDVKEECLVNRFAPQTVTDCSRASYSAEGNFADKFDVNDKVAVLVYADLVEQSGSSVEVTAFEDERGYEMTHTIVHPQKQEHYLVFEEGNYHTPAFAHTLSEADMYENTSAGLGLNAHREVLAPRETEETVKIALFRLPDDTSDLDYLCNFGKVSPWQGNYPILGVPVHGELGINMGAFYEDANHKSQLICTVTQEDFDGVRVIASSADNSEYAVPIVCDTNGKRSFIYDFVGSWNVGYIHPGMWEQLKYSYTLTFDGFYRIDEHSDIHPCHYSITSGQPVKGKILEGRAPYLIIEWGCLDKDTMIEMADGGRKRIREIVIGDMVCTAVGGGGRECAAAGRVKNVWRGMEAGCRLITVENGQNIKATGNHPFLTADGWKLADKLRAGDKMLAAGGKEQNVTAVETVEEVCEVYNLEFDAPSIVFANGFQTGDFLVQNGRLPEG